MGWQATGDSWAGGEPGQDPGLPAQPGPPAGFGHDGSWSTVAPSAALAAALEHAAGPASLYESADTDALIGIARQWAAVESWAASGKLAALRAMTCEDGDGTPRLRRRRDLPEGWDDSLTYEVSGALAMGPVSAGNLASLAWTLGTRLAGIGRLLAAGTLNLSKARLVAQLFEPLDDDEAARAEALILEELAGKTYPQVDRLAWRAALAVAPDVAERGRRAGERRARVTVFREEAGTVGLSGRDLPAADALAGHANVLARAREYAASGAFPGQAGNVLEALAYLDLLNGISAQERIAFTRSVAAEPAGHPGPDEGDGLSDGGHGPSGGPGPDDGPGSSGEDGGDGSDHLPDSDSTGPDEPGDEGGTNDPRTLAPPLAEVTVPLVTLRRQAERAGDNRLIGPLDPALARDLAAAAARSPWSRWEVTVVDEHGYAVGHGIARPARGTGPPPQPPPTGPPGGPLPARGNITITQAFLHQLQAQTAQPRPGAPPGSRPYRSPMTRAD